MIKELFTKENLYIWLNPAIIFVLTLILLFLNIYIGILGIFLFIVACYHAYETFKNKSEEFKHYMDNLNVAFDGITKKAIFSMPFPVAVINSDGELSWYNSKFKDMVNEKESMIEEKIFNIIPEITKDILKNKEEEFEIEYSYRKYDVHVSHESSSKENMSLLYFIDDTEKEKVLADYENERMVLLNIRLDNYEELASNVSSERRPIIFAEIDTLITSYFHDYEATITKIENARYQSILFKEILDKMLEDKFSFIESVRNISSGNTITPTLSIGVGYNEENPRQIEKSANAAIDIALGRGGDQLVLKSQDKLTYFGGKNQATEKRTKVRARVIAHALKQLISKSTTIFISGHKNPDMDSFGSALGLWYACRRDNKTAFIVLSEVTPAIENLYNYAIEGIEGLKEYIISPEDAYNEIEASSLFIITDNHRKNSVEEARLFEKTDSVVVIDHHRRGKDYIENAILNYVEPYASSASELVTEMLIYMNEQVEIEKHVAEGLLAGIMVDTKSFNQQTGIRTFEAAVALKENGADITKINRLFSEELETLKSKSEIISNSEIYKEKYIFGYYPHDTEESTLVASQAADELMTIQNIEASFVFALSKGKVHISARSYGDVSVQLIMEKLNGGGHRTIAATQLEMTMEEARDLLKKAISEYNEEEK